MPSREELLNTATAALDDLSDVLSETAQLRREITQQDLSEAVDRLMESAAQDCRMAYVEQIMQGLGPPGIPNRQWAQSMAWTIEPSDPPMRYQDLIVHRAFRLCSGRCQDLEWEWDNPGKEQPYRCGDCGFDREDPYFEAFFWTMTEDGPDEKTISYTIDNMDVLNDPPDGVDAGYHFSAEDLADHRGEMTQEQIEYFGVPQQGQTFPVLEHEGFVVISHVPDMVIVTEQMLEASEALTTMLEGLAASYDQFVEAYRRQRGMPDG